MLFVFIFPETCVNQTCHFFPSATTEGPTTPLMTPEPTTPPATEAPTTTPQPTTAQSTTPEVITPYPCPYPLSVNESVEQSK